MEEFTKMQMLTGLGQTKLVGVWDGRDRTIGINNQNIMGFLGYGAAPFYGNCIVWHTKEFLIPALFSLIQ